MHSSVLRQIIGRGTGLTTQGRAISYFGAEILKLPHGQPANFSYFLSEAIMYRHEIYIEDLS